MLNNPFFTILNFVFSTLILALLYPVFTTPPFAPPPQGGNSKPSLPMMVYRLCRQTPSRSILYAFVSFATVIAITCGDDDVVGYAIDFLLLALFFAIPTLWNLNNQSDANSSGL
jgi:hypothetical protein